MSEGEPPLKDEDAESPKHIAKELQDVIKNLEERGGPLCRREGCEDPVERSGLCAAHLKEEIQKQEDERFEMLRGDRAEKARNQIAHVLGAKYVRCNWDNLDHPRKAEIRGVIAKGESAFLTGTTGNGKTHCLSAIYRDLWLSGATVEVWTAPDLLDALRRQAGESATTDKFFQRMRETDWLLIDDIGQDRSTDFSVEQLVRVFDWRDRDEKPIVVTSNLGLETLRKDYGGRIVSRIVGLIGSNAFKFEGRDRRMDKMREAIDERKSQGGGDHRE